MRSWIFSPLALRVGNWSRSVRPCVWRVQARNVSQDTSAGSVTSLLKKVHESTKTYLDFLQSQNLPEPSYQHGHGIDPRVPLPQDVMKARDAAIEATDELHHLLIGPWGLLLGSPGGQLLMLSLQYIYRYKIAESVPLEGQTTFEELARATSLGEKDLTRFLRVAISRHVFHEPEKGVIIHTAASKLLLNNKMLESWILLIAQEFWPAYTRTVEATEKWPESEESNETGYSLANGTSLAAYDYIREDPQRQEQFTTAMRFSHLYPEFHLSHLLQNYDFHCKGTGPLIVDVGGSNGEVSIEIASKYPDARCIVQDLPDVISGLEKYVPVNLKDRVTGMVQDIFTSQKVHGADIYLLRWILHSFSDKYAIEILRNLTPALKKGARVVINDICLPEPGQIGIKADRDLRFQDISLKAFSNARERDAGTWKELFQKADPRFRLLDVSVPPGARMAIIEAEWIGS